VGFALGFVVLIRMNELYAVFIPLFWGIGNWQNLKERALFFSNFFKKYIVWAILPVILIFLPQLIYWHFVSGQWIYNAYVGEKFDFENPHITEGMFGFQNGWIPWTPIMLFAILGLLGLRRYARAAFLPTLLILPLHIFIIYSWWCWYYINGLGSRPMVEMYALMSFSLGAFYTFLMRFKNLGTAFITAIILIFSVFNVFKIYQERQGLIWAQFTNRSFYWEMLTATKSSRESLAAWMSNEKQPRNLPKIKDVVVLNFEDSTMLSVTAIEKFSGRFSFVSQDTVSNLLELPLSKNGIQPNDYIGLRFQGFFHEKDRVTPVEAQTMLKVFFYSKEKKEIKERGFRLQPFIGNPDFNIWTTGEAERWGEIVVFVKVPPKMDTEGFVQISVYNATKRPFFIDDLRVELWRK
jgi:hypothetical protein